MSVGDWIVPALLLLAVLAGVFRRVPVYDAFLRGAREGLKTAWQVLPCLAAVLLAVGLLTACGALDALCAGLARPLAALRRRWACWKACCRRMARTVKRGALLRRWSARARRSYTPARCIWRLRA